QPGGSSSDSRLSGTSSPIVGIGGAGGGIGSGGLGGSNPNDIVASRSGAFGRTSPGTGSGAFGSSGAFGGGRNDQGAILPGVRITADAVNNTLLIYANQESYRIIEQTLRQLDRPQLQVGIDATIAEITLNENLNYGVQAFLSS